MPVASTAPRRLTLPRVEHGQAEQPPLPASPTMRYNALCCVLSRHAWKSSLTTPSVGCGLNLETRRLDFTLYGGTAIALRLGHRQSLDFDFFAQTPFEADALLKDIPYLKDVVVRQSSPNTLTETVDRGGPVQVSFSGNLGLGQVEAPDLIREPKLAIASLIDLAGTKAKVILQRVESKDYIDIHALMTKGSIPLAKIVAAASVIFGPQVNPLDALKAIAYHQDPALAVLSDEIKADLVKAMQTTDLDNLPILSPIKEWRARA